jgi:hypothetical protein
MDSIEFVSNSSEGESDSDGDIGSGDFGDSSMDEDSELSNSLDYYGIDDGEMEIENGKKKKAERKGSSGEKKKKFESDGLDFDDDFLAQAVAKKKQKQQQFSEKSKSDSVSVPSLRAFSSADDSARAMALEVTRAKHTLNQHYFWDQFVGVRLGLQPAMSAVANLPKLSAKVVVEKDGTVLRFGEG